MTLLLTYFFLALSVAFICSILEAVLLSSTNSYIETLSKDIHGEAVHTLKRLKSNIDRPISSILTFNTFAQTMGATAVGAQAQKIFDSDMQAVTAFVLTLSILYISEIIPKTIGAIYWKRLLIPAAFFIEFLMKVTYPFVWLSTHITNFISKGKKQSSDFTRDEIMAVVAMGEREGSIQSKESHLIENLLKLKHIKAKDIMTPRSVVVAFQKDTTVEEAIEDDRMYIHSRLPIYDETIDNIVGIVLNQSILEESVEERDSTKLRDISIEPHRVSENIPVSMLMDMFIKRKTHLFIVQDSYGQTAGVVTLEDVIEVLLGVEIVDEMDEVEDMQVFAKTKNKNIQNRMLLEKKKKEKILTK
ncbi:MAG: hemolysin family protein [Sulfurovaceae bacterium]|nr:hemolysin family protein [Sulfurovaceae bacterium]